jgi:hypothetical protein
MVWYVLLRPLRPELDGQDPFQKSGLLCQTSKTPTLYSISCPCTFMAMCCCKTLVFRSLEAQYFPKSAFFVINSHNSGIFWLFIPVDYPIFKLSDCRNVSPRKSNLQLKKPSQRKTVAIIITRAFWTRPFRRTRTQTEVRNSDSDLRNRDFPTP